MQSVSTKRQEFYSQEQTLSVSAREQTESIQSSTLGNFLMEGTNSVTVVPRAKRAEAWWERSPKEEGDLDGWIE